MCRDTVRLHIMRAQPLDGGSNQAASLTLLSPVNFNNLPHLKSVSSVSKFQMSCHFCVFYGGLCSNAMEGVSTYIDW